MINSSDNPTDVAVSEDKPACNPKLLGGDELAAEGPLAGVVVGARYLGTTLTPPAGDWSEWTPAVDRLLIPCASRAL